MKHYQNTLTGEVVSEDEYSYAAAQKVAILKDALVTRL